ncbi:vanZ like family protein [Burkholderia pseudomallei MSHR1328]|nr:vanZ like family protein [Burkholderia pseudomallei MSHR1328]
MTPAARRQRRHSTLARQAFAVYAALVVYASLYPFTGWRSLGIGPFDFLLAPLPRYLTAFDVVSNVLGYLPFGALAVLALYPLRGVPAALAATLLGALLSGAMEALQTYLPTRVSSNLDLAANALGALVGAAAAAPAATALIERGVVRRVRFAWFEREASTPLFLSALWAGAILFPSPFLFGIGDWPSELWERADVTMRGALLAWAPDAWNVPAWPERLDGLLSDSAWETLLAALGLFAALAVASLAMRERAPRVRLVVGFAACALALKAAATFMQSYTGLVLDWATPGALRGHRGGLVAARVALRLPPAWRRGARGGRARRRARARQRAARQSVLRFRAVRLAAGPLCAFQQHRALARVDLAVRGARLARRPRGARVARAARRGRFAPRQRQTAPVAIIGHD